MRPAAAVLVRAHRARVAIRVTEGRLTVAAPKLVLTAGLRSEVQARKKELVDLLTGPCAPVPEDWHTRLASWPNAASEALGDVEAALAAAGADRHLERAFHAIDGLIPAWQARLAAMPPDLGAAAAALAWLSVWDGAPVPEPPDRCNPWAWTGPEGLRAAREALRRGLGALA